MCGIAGVFLRASDSSAIAGLSRLLDAIRHRGYSCHEAGNGPNWAIGANRLEIVDGSNGRQPFYSDAGSIAVVFNGEIYNHKELRALLKADGYQFISETDTEVIAHGFHRWGDALFDRLDGMFAIIIHDSRDNTFVLARDPIGVKPLYCAVTESGTYVASEIKSLIYIGAQIDEVPPGCIVRQDGSIDNYVKWPNVAVEERLEDNAIALRQLLSESVRKRVDTDLPIAVFLSGGIDSAAVIYEAARHHQDVTGFTIGRDDSDDVLAAKRLGQELGLKIRHVHVSEDELLAVVNEVIWCIESFEPNHIRGGTLSYLLAREVAQAGYRVALCGEGADELFAGYREFSLAVLRHESPQNINALTRRFVSELHRTQLKRVDRTSMRFTLEVREPFLDKKIVAFSDRLPLEQKVCRMPDGSVVDKRVLRAAYTGFLPDWTVNRSKTVLSLGAGFGSNGAEGPFFDYGQKMVGESEFMRLLKDYPDYHLQNREEACYFKVFHDVFGELALAKQRPVVNATSAKA